MNAAEAEQVARLLEQYQDLFGFAAAALLPQNSAVQVGALLNRLGVRNPYGGLVFGFTALAIVYTYDAVAKELQFPASIVREVDRVRLNVQQNTISPPDGGSAEVACLRHLRNCFAHGRFTVAVNGAQTMVTMRDFNPGGVQTFEAVCEAQVVAEIAEKLLVAAHGEAAAIALPQAPCPAAPPGAAAPPAPATP